MLQQKMFYAGSLPGERFGASLPRQLRELYAACRQPSLRAEPNSFANHADARPFETFTRCFFF